MIPSWVEICSRLKYNPLKISSSRKGIALILALMSLMFMVYIASEVTRDSSIEYIVNSQELNRLKAYYSAKNGLQFALLRVKVFQQVSQNNLPEGIKEIIDRIGWKDPFMWPIPLPEDINAVDKDTITGINAESLMDSQFTHTIEDEGSKIDVNDLNSPSKALREVTKKQLLAIFEQKMNTDDDFRAEHQGANFAELIDRIYDWMSDSNESILGGDKRSTFAELGSAYPPNRAFRTIDEIRLVPGMKEEYFNLLKPRITIYGMKAINPNTASKAVLLSLDSGMTEEAVNEAIERRSNAEKGGPFKGEKEKCLEDFKSFVESRGARLSAEFNQIPMICNKVFNFRIKSTGIFGSGKFAQQKNIEAIVMDLNNSVTQVKSFLEKEKTDSQQQPPPAGAPPGATAPGTPGAGSTSGGQKQEPLPKGPPRIVYWTEN